jgi:uncharacterized nucleotidyltransferase DUF6036
MPLSSQSLVQFLGEVERELGQDLVLVAAGGTALTLLDVKESTVDVDFTGPRDSIKVFRRALDKIPHGFKVDLWNDGQVFSQFLPGDYLKRSIEIRQIRRIQLRALAPVDVIMTKAGRLDERDKEDIEDCIRKFALKKNEIASRAAKVAYVGREETYRENVKAVLDHFFPK